MRTGLTGEVGGHTPVGNIGVIKGGLEGLVFNEQLLALSEMAVGAAKGVFKPADAFPHALGAGVVGAIGEPEGQVARTQLL